MCGIAGIINFNNTPVLKNQLETLSSFLQERGPDHNGYYLNQNIGFAHTRLSILDLDARSNQPMISKNTAITFNGEIYNFQGLKNELKKANVSFSTTSDTEVILKGYELWGIDLLAQKLDGMFALGIFDKAANKVFLLRDRFGKKPLYYYIDNETFYFSSDIRAIHQAKKTKLTLNLDALDYYFTEIAIPQPYTIWKEIHQIKPSHFTVIDIRDKHINEKQYWKLTTSQEHHQLSFEDVFEQTEKKIISAITKRQVADVPVGAFLSGGVDSGLIVSLMAQNTGNRVKTFSVGFEGMVNDELKDAKKVATRYNTDHQEIKLSPNILETIPNLIEYIGEPFADTSIIPTYYISKAISKNVTVALSGDGGDELFGGYNNYDIAYKTDNFITNNPNKLNRLLISSLSKVSSRIGLSDNYGDAYEYIDMPPHEKLYRHIGFSEKEKYLLYGSNKTNFSKKYLADHWNRTFQEDSLTDSLLLSSLQTRLLNTYLVKVDRASMINSLEVRSPFLDYELAEWAFSISNQWKFKNNTNKYILKKIAEKHVNPSILTAKKTGFSLPISYWLSNEGKDSCYNILHDPLLYKHIPISKEYCCSLLNDIHKNGNKLWVLICLFHWLSHYRK